MNESRDGGPAFPIHQITPHLSDASGMSLLDYFAGQALVGLMAKRDDFRPEWQDKCVWRAYSVAAAMLKARGGQ